MLLAFLVVPPLAHAEGWLLMVPPNTPLPVLLGTGTPVTGAWYQAHDNQVQADIRAPLAQWTQYKAFDSAHACETELANVKSMEENRLQWYTRQRRNAPFGSDERDIAWRTQIIQTGHVDRWNHARCLPASQVPVR
jgi:hypothetical protein